MPLQPRSSVRVNAKVLSRVLSNTEVLVLKEVFITASSEMIYVPLARQYQIDFYGHQD
jgi:hypothetical protein